MSVIRANPDVLRKFLAYNLLVEAGVAEEYYEEIASAEACKEFHRICKGCWLNLHQDGGDEKEVCLECEAKGYHSGDGFVWDKDSNCPGGYKEEQSSCGGPELLPTVANAIQTLQDEIDHEFKVTREKLKSKNPHSQACIGNASSFCECGVINHNEVPVPLVAE